MYLPVVTWGDIILPCLQICFVAGDQWDVSAALKHRNIIYIYSEWLLESGSEQLDDPDSLSLTSALNPWRI